MSRFLDGPAAGIELAHRRAPIYLRVVEGGYWDVLDQLDDAPAPDEIVHVYRKVPGSSGVFFACTRGGDGGRYEYGDYTHLSDVDGELLRDTAAWRAWVEERARVDDVAAQFEGAYVPPSSA